jgi:SAM-dependent methyltransferase
VPAARPAHHGKPMEPKDVTAESDSCDSNECDTFQFMATHLGVTVLHPGGLAATQDLAERCKLSPEMTILDAGCGSGSSTIFLARRFGCRVVGMDTDLTLLRKANEAARKAKLLDRVAFRLGDLHEIPFDDDSFDGAIAQAVLIFTDKRRAVEQISRTLHRGGFLGSVELTWRRVPSKETLSRVRATLCSVAANAEGPEGWMKVLRDSGLTPVEAEMRDVDFSFRGMLANEGAVRAVRIATRSLLERSSRRKTQQVARLLREVRPDLGYGMFIARKP